LLELARDVVAAHFAVLHAACDAEAPAGSCRSSPLMLAVALLMVEP
jgi:hypothetical protein